METKETVFVQAPAETDNRPVYVKEILSFRFLVWAFFIFGILGILIEGVFCIFFYGHWETHVTTVFLWLNGLYGVGAVLYFVMAAKMDKVPLVWKVVIMTVAATILELLAGLLLLYGINMRAWDYFDTTPNFMGLIAPLYALGWAIPALLVSLTYRKLGTAAAKLKGKAWGIIAQVFGFLLAIDLLLASMCMARWSSRHYNGPSEHPSMIDRFAPDEWMANRFIEWKFEE